MKQLMPKANFVFLPDLLHELTYRKSPEELRAMAKAGQLAIKALEAVKATARPGVREYQLAGAVANAVLSEGGRYHLLMIGSTSMQDPKLIFPNPNPSARVLKEGDIILSELAMSYMGYSAKIGHPITVGQADGEVQHFLQGRGGGRVQGDRAHCSSRAPPSKRCARRAAGHSASGARSRARRSCTGSISSPRCRSSAPTGCAPSPTTPSCSRA